jgi:hypothetical protein
MYVHLIRTEGVSIEQYTNVINLLRSFQGPINYISSEESQIIDHVTEKYWEDPNDFKAKTSLLNRMYSPNPAKATEDYIPYSFPLSEPQVTWNDLFTVCEAYRNRHFISENDIIIILTELSNDKNWFGGVDESMKNIFIQTSHWSHFFGSQIDDRFPICYEVVAWMMRIKMFQSRTELAEAMHRSAIGCMMDYCKNKMEIVLKMRTADICKDCLTVIGNKELPRPLIQQLFETMDGIRRHLMFRERSEILNRPSRLEIRGYNHRVFLTELGDLEVALNPKERALFVFFLKHPGGISLPELFDHQAEIGNYYRRFSRNSSPGEIAAAIVRLVNPLDDNQQQVLSRIRKKFRDLLGRNMAEYYTIEVKDGKYSIALNRELVSFRDTED